DPLLVPIAFAPMEHERQSLHLRIGVVAPELDHADGIQLLDVLLLGDLRLQRERKRRIKFLPDRIAVQQKLLEGFLHERGALAPSFAGPLKARNQKRRDQRADDEQYEAVTQV